MNTNNKIKCADCRYFSINYGNATITSNTINTTLDEFPAETHAVFVVKNTGNVLLRDIQISAAQTESQQMYKM
jgi:hypothetical protein